MGLVKKVDHVAIIAKDLEESINFYTKILGFELIAREVIDHQKIKNAILRAAGDSFVVELVQFTDDREYYYGDGMFEVLALKVDDIFETVKMLKAQGIEFLLDEPVQMAPDDFFTFFRGPAGEKLEIIQNKRDF